MATYVNAEPKITYIVTQHYKISTTGEDAIREFSITIPTSWKITYGLLHPGTKGNWEPNGHVLRIYEGKDRQRAVFRGVLEFHSADMDMKVNEDTGAPDRLKAMLQSVVHQEAPF